MPVDLETASNRAVRTLEAVIRRDSLLNTLLVPAAALLPAGGSLKGEIDTRREASLDVEPWCVRPGETLTPLTGAAADGGHRFENCGHWCGAPATAFRTSRGATSCTARRPPPTSCSRTTRSRPASWRR